MSIEFFIKPDTQQLMRNYLKNLETYSSQDESGFSSERNKLIIDMMESFLHAPSVWDGRSQFNIQIIGEVLIKELKYDLNEKNINLMFSSCFRFYLETYVFDNAYQSQSSSALKNFAIYRQNEFDPISHNQITYALKEMPIDMLRKLLAGDSVKTYKEYVERANDLEDAGRHWEVILSENIEKSQQLNKALLEQSTAFNFVGLYRGFADLGDKKQNELKWARYFMFTLALLIPIPLLIEMFWLTDSSAITDNWKGLIKIIPTLSLTIILIYFFKVSLVNYNSVRSQLVQIDLRKSLCQFIQNYATYAKDIRDGSTDLLVKFEEIIFSNIMPSEEKIPSTFDGIEQLASLVASFKSGK